MGDPMKAKKTWIFIGDGSRARIVEQTGVGGDLAPVPGRAFEIHVPPTRELGTERPARRGGRGMTPRHGVAPRVDWHRAAEREFADRMADALSRAARRHAFDNLVLVAPPKTLGELRRRLTPAARRTVSAEIAKDLTHVGLHELPPHLAGAIIE
jgi:protein required for attachment to host cells